MEDKEEEGNGESKSIWLHTGQHPRTERSPSDDRDEGDGRSRREHLHRPPIWKGFREAAVQTPIALARQELRALRQIH